MLDPHATNHGATAAGEAVLLDHDADGIREYDNPMPGWWKFAFLGTMAFAIGYWVYYGFIETQANRLDVYAAEMKIQDEANAKLAALQMTEEKLQALVGDKDLLAKGETKFKTVCFACHGLKANGMVTDAAPGLGPNLTDNAWIHGGNLIDIYTTVTKGVEAKGMQAWGKILPPDELNGVVLYVNSLRNTNVAGKPPQGDPWKPLAAGK